MVTEDMVAMLGRAAGFELAPERCKLLAPQLDWLLGEAKYLASLDLSREEPLCVFRPAPAPTIDTGEENPQADRRASHEKA